MLFTLIYRRKIAGAQKGFIDATDLQQAELVGRAYCEKTDRVTFVAVESALLADASILNEPPKTEPSSVSPTPDKSKMTFSRPVTCK